MSARANREYLAGRYVAQEARKDMRAGDHAYANTRGERFVGAAMGQVVNTDSSIPRESGPQYAEGVPGGELQGNLCEVAQVQPAGPKTKAAREASDTASEKAPARVDSPARAGPDWIDDEIRDLQVKAEHYAGREGQLSLLDLRQLPALHLPMPPSVNEAWYEVPYVDDKTSPRLPLHKRLKVRKVLTDEHRQFRSVVIGRVRGEMLRANLRAQPLLGRLEMRVMLYYRDRRRTDVDNRVKPLQDALTHAGAYRDDTQIDRIIVERTVDGAKEERCIVCLRELSS